MPSGTEKRPTGSSNVPESRPGYVKLGGFPLPNTWGIIGKVDVPGVISGGSKHVVVPVGKGEGTFMLPHRRSSLMGKK